MADQQVGQTLDALGVELDLEPEHQVTEVFVVAKFMDLNTGGTGIVLGASAGLDWLAQLALLQGADIIIRRDLEGSL